MNGIYDMGGMTCFGPVERDAGEPVFHADWERRVFAVNLAGLAFFGPVDRVRHVIERMDPTEYLATSYYEHWLAAVETLGKEMGYLTETELQTGEPINAAALPHPPPNAEMIEHLVREGLPATREGARQPAFEIGDRVRARNLEITGHTRLPRYVRGRIGVVQMLQGIHIFPDTLAHDRGENAQPLYNVRFEARELWGDNVKRKDCVHIDLWEDYLQAVD